MIELSEKRIEQILHEETVKTEELTTILRGIYTRYMRLYEKYFADIDTLNDDKISELRKYSEETESLIKYYYMDIPQDICVAIKEFDKKSSHLLGLEWRECLFRAYNDFKEEYEDEDKNEKCVKAEFTKQALAAFYDEMDGVFREGFGTVSHNTETVISGIAGLLFGKQE